MSPFRVYPIQRPMALLFGAVTYSRQGFARSTWAARSPRRLCPTASRCGNSLALSLLGLSGRYRALVRENQRRVLGSATS